MTETIRTELQERVARQSGFLSPVLGIFLLAISKLLPEKEPISENEQKMVDRLRKTLKGKGTIDGLTDRQILNRLDDLTEVVQEAGAGPVIEQEKVSVTIILSDGTEIGVSPISTARAKEYEKLRELIQAENVRLTAHMFGVSVEEAEPGDQAWAKMGLMNGDGPALGAVPLGAFDPADRSEAIDVDPWVAQPMTRIDRNGRHVPFLPGPIHRYELSAPNLPPMTECQIDPFDIHRDTWQGERLDHLILRYFLVELEGKFFTGIAVERCELGLRLFGVSGRPDNPSVANRTLVGEIDLVRDRVHYHDHQTGKVADTVALQPLMDPDQQLSNGAYFSGNSEYCMPARNNIITGLFQDTAPRCDCGTCREERATA